MVFSLFVGVHIFILEPTLIFNVICGTDVMPKRNDLEQKALHFVIGTGFKGVLQSELWRELDASSREGSRVAIKLEEKGLVRREKELQGGRWTYRLFPKRMPASIESIADCPCLLCKDNARCDPTTTISPKDCVKLTEWIIALGESNPDALSDDGSNGGLEEDALGEDSLAESMDPR
jgi:hypothetical protein